MLGVVTELQRYAPSLAKLLGRGRKAVFDAVVRETGNYARQFADNLQRLLSAGAGRELPVRRFLWNSLNNHVGRADGAVQLLVELGELAREFRSSDPADPPRIMLWGHSHGGNVLALVSLLLAADEQRRDAFFTATEKFYRAALSSRIVRQPWRAAQQLLDQKDHPLRNMKLDVVTFGTPIRYGWRFSNSTADGIDSLLHFVDHRPHEGQPDYLAAKRLRLRRMLTAEDGDYVARLGIAGSNFPPAPLAVRTFMTDRKLDRLLAGDLKREGLLARFHYGQRVPDAGTTLLVDYRDAGWRIFHHVLGHACYTRTPWLPLHCEQIAAHFYAAAG